MAGNAQIDEEMQRIDTVWRIQWRIPDGWWWRKNQVRWRHRSGRRFRKQIRVVDRWFLRHRCRCWLQLALFPFVVRRSLEACRLWLIREKFGTNGTTTGHCCNVAAVEYRQLVCQLQWLLWMRCWAIISILAVLVCDFRVVPMLTPRSFAWSAC